MTRFWVVLAVAVGGALGTIARYELALAEPAGSGRFPWATFIVNVVGSFVLGFALAALTESWSPSRLVRPLVAVGFCGGLTTFSTWMVESVLLVRDGATGTAVLYVAASLVIGFGAAALGVTTARAALPGSGPFSFDPRADD